MVERVLLFVCLFVCFCHISACNMSKRKQTWDNYKEKVAKKDETTKGQLLLPGGSDGITVLRGWLARWKANARSTRRLRVVP